MSTIDESLSDILDVEPISSYQEEGHTIMVYQSPAPLPPAPIQTPDEQIEEDAALVRKNIKTLLANGNSALETLIEVSAESQHPRAFEVVATMLKTLSEINKDLLDIHKSKKNLLGGGIPVGNTVINANQAVFFGSTAELSARMKQQKEEVANGHSSLSQ